MMYFLLPVALFVMGICIDRLAADVIVVRCGSRVRWLGECAWRSLKNVIPCGLCLAGAALAVGLTGSFSGEWSEVARASDLKLTSELAQLGWSPWLLGAFVLGAYMVNVATLSVLVAATSIFLGTRAIMPLIATVYCLAVIGFQTGWQFGPLNLADGVVLQAAMSHYGPSPWALMAPMAGGLSIAFGLAFVADMFARDELFLRRTLPAGVTCIGILLVVFQVDSMVRQLPGMPASEVFYGIFYGIDPGGVRLVDYLFVGLLGIGPALWVLIRLDDDIPRVSWLLMRYGTLARWWWRTLWPAVGFVALFWLMVTSVAVVVVLGMVDPPGDLAVSKLAGDAVRVLVLGTLQSWCYLLFASLGRWLAGDSWGGLSVLGGVFAGGAILGPAGFLPMGLNSLGMTGAIPGLFEPVLVLMAWLTISLLVAIVVTLNRRRLERNMGE